MVMPSGSSMNMPTGMTTQDLYNMLNVLFGAGNTAKGNENDFQLGQAQNATTQRGQDYNYQLGQGQNSNTAQGNQLNYAARMAEIQASLNSTNLDNNTRMKIAELTDKTQRLDVEYRNALELARLAHQTGQDAFANQMQEKAFGLQQQQFDLLKSAQNFSQTMDVTKFWTDQKDLDRKYNLDVARFNSDDANRAFQNGMASAQFGQGQYQFDQQNALDRSRFNLDRQNQTSNQALQYANFGLDQSRFALDRDKQRADMAAHPYNAFANAVMARGGTPSAAYAPFGTPGSGWAYGYQDPAPTPPSRVLPPPVPGMVKGPGFSTSPIKAPTFPASGGFGGSSGAGIDPDWLLKSVGLK